MRCKTHEGLIGNGDLDNVITRHSGKTHGSTASATFIGIQKLVYLNPTGCNSTKLLLQKDCCEIYTLKTTEPYGPNDAPLLFYCL